MDLQCRVIYTTRARLINISLGGAFIGLDRRLQMDQSYTLRLECEDHVLTLPATVVWEKVARLVKNDAGDLVPYYEVGLSFLHAGFADHARAAFQEALEASREQILRGEFLPGSARRRALDAILYSVRSKLERLNDGKRSALPVDVRGTSMAEPKAVAGAQPLNVATG